MALPTAAELWGQRWAEAATLLLARVCPGAPQGRTTCRSPGPAWGAVAMGVAPQGASSQEQVPQQSPPSCHLCQCQSRALVPGGC